MNDRAAPAAEAAATQADLAGVRRRIDDIVAFQQKKPSLYRDTGIMISAAAFFISVMTTVVSWYRTYQQDVEAKKTQLRTVLLQAYALNIQNIELGHKLKDDYAAFMNASSTLNAQNLMLAKEAYAVARSLGKSASSMDLVSVANALIQSSEVSLVEDLLKQAVERAENSVERLAALRLLGSTQYATGRRAEADASFTAALSVFEKYPQDANNLFNVQITHAFTHVYWANAVGYTDCAVSQKNLASATQYLDRLPSNAPQVSTLKTQIEQWNAALAACPS